MDSLAILTANRTSRPEPHGRPHLWALILLALGLLVVAVLKLSPAPTVPPGGEATPTPEREARIYTVTYRFGVFSPTNLRIRAGDTVRFRNDSNSAVRIVADPLPGRRLPEFDSIGEVQPGSYFSYTFSSTGTFAYRSQAHADQAGVVIVR